jgi:hypothetical protein
LRVPSFLVLACLAASLLQGCSSEGGRAAATPLPEVSPVAAQPLPAWFESISPTGEAAAGAQVRLRFRNDVIPLASLESPERQSALEHFRIEPAVPGRFTFLTPRMVGFQADAQLPQSSRLKITVTGGLSDLAGHTLAGDFAWSFTTPAIALTNLTGADVADADLRPVDLRPRVSVRSNVELDPASLAANAKLAPDSQAGTLVDLAVVPEPSPSPGAPDATGPNSDDNGYVYELTPPGDLAAGTRYSFVVAPGVMPLHGNLASAARFEGKLKTRGPLTFAGISTLQAQGLTAQSRFAAGDPILRFSNPLDPKSVKAAIAVSPSPDPSLPLAAADEGDSYVRLNAYALKARTHYTVSVAGTLTDSFGQKLGDAPSVAFDTGDLTPDVWAPTGYNAFPAGAPVQLNVETTNLPDGRYRSTFKTVQPTDLIARDPNDGDALAAWLPPVKDWTTVTAPNRPNAVARTPVDLRAKLGANDGALVYGVAATIPGRVDAPSSFFGIVQLTNVGIFAQWFPSGGFVRLAHLADGSPIPAATIELYESNLANASSAQTPKPPANTTPCASGRSDASGTWTLDSAAFAKCASTARDATLAPELLVVAREGADWAFVRSQPWGYDANVNIGWSAGQPQSYGTILTDRNLYQPGESAQIFGVGYFDIDGTLQRGRAAAYDVTLQSPSGKKRALGKRALDAFGAFTLSVPFDRNAETGVYAVHASAANGETLDGSLRVAQFKPPNFKVELKLDRQFAEPDTSVSADSTSTYLFGAPVEGGTQHVYVTRSRAYFTPEGRDAYQFGRTWNYPEEPPSVSPDVIQKDIDLGPGGKASLAIPVGNDLPFPMQYQVDAETTDASNLSVADSKTFTALPSAALIGLKGDFVAQAGTPFSLEGIVTDARGTMLEGKHVKLTLQRRDYSSVTQVVEGSEQPRDAVRYVDAGSAEFDSGTQPSKLTLTAPVPGSYRVRANFGDAPSDATATDLDIWISGAGQTDWGGEDPNRLTVKLDKTSYRPGETASALIQSPYADADLFFAVVRHGVLYRTTQHVTGAAPQVRFTVTADMLPNAAAEAVLVRRGPSLARGVPSKLGRLAMSGFAGFDVGLDGRYLKVAVRPRAARLEPGASQSLQVHLSDVAGKPAAGELAVAVVNDAVLQLTGYRFPDLVKIVYAEQPISTRIADSRDAVRLVTEHQYVDKGFGFGGGAMAGLGSTRVRTNFKALAFWSGALRTDANGNATIEFATPDDLTTWRVMVLALTKDARFGNGEATFIATKPLVTNPILPQFARPGDRFSLGLALTDIAKSGGTAAISATLSGPLSFASGGKQAELQQPVDALNSAAHFDVVADGTGTATVGIATTLGPHRDAFSVPLIESAQGVTETVATSGATAGAALSIPLDVPAYAGSALGGLDLSLANTLLGEVRETQRVLAEERPPFAYALASRIAIAADSLLLGRKMGPASDAATLQRTLGGDLAALEALTLPDGSYAPWPGAKAGDIWSTAFAATQLVQARSAGADAGAALAHARRFLEARLADPSPDCDPKGDETCRAAVRLEALETLAFMGSPRNEFVADIWAKREALSYGERVELARFLLVLPQWRAQGLALRDKLLEQVYETARRGTVNDPGAGETPVAAQSQLLALLVESAMPAERIDKVLSSLLAMRRNGTWGCACDDAEALNALTVYTAKIPPPGDFSVDVRAGAASATATFQGYAHSLQALSFPLGDRGVPAGKSALAITKRGTGTLHYTAALRYAAPDAGPGAYAGIRIDRLVHPANAATTLATFGLAQVAPDATHLAAAQVFEIEDRIITDHALDDVIVTDPLPAGLEAIDAGFQTSTKYFQASSDDWQINYQQIYRDRVLAFAQHLPAGVYAVHYLVRSVTPGIFAWPGAEVSLQYAPEEFGRTASSRLTIDAR